MSYQVLSRKHPKVHIKSWLLLHTFVKIDVIDLSQYFLVSLQYLHCQYCNTLPHLMFQQTMSKSICLKTCRWTISDWEIDKFVITESAPWLKPCTHRARNIDKLLNHSSDHRQELQLLSGNILLLVKYRMKLIGEIAFANNEQLVNTITFFPCNHSNIKLDWHLRSLGKENHFQLCDICL